MALTVVRAELEFSGYLKSGDGPRFVLTETSTGETSGFLTLGGSFAGGKIVEFNVKDEVLTVTRGSEALRLPLKAPRMRDGKATADESKVVRMGVTKDGGIQFDGRLLSAAVLDEILAQIALTDKEVRVEIAGRAPFEAVTRFMDAVRAAGIKKLRVQAGDDSSAGGVP
jgi:biopolymer transport protein ExbD